MLPIEKIQGLYYNEFQLQILERVQKDYQKKYSNLLLKREYLQQFIYDDILTEGINRFLYRLGFDNSQNISDAYNENSNIIFKRIAEIAKERGMQTFQFLDSLSLNMQEEEQFHRIMLYQYVFNYLQFVIKQGKQ